MKRIGYFIAGGVVGASVLAFLVQQNYIELPNFGCCDDDGAHGCCDDTGDSTEQIVEITSK